MPKPGEWMERVKQFMGFRCWRPSSGFFTSSAIKKDSRGSSGRPRFYCVSAIACWIYGAFCGPSLPGSHCRFPSGDRGDRSGRRQVFPRRAVRAFRGCRRNSNTCGGDTLEALLPKSLDALLKDKKPVFVDFTADWSFPASSMSELRLTLLRYARHSKVMGSCR